jgi:protein-S-isoprenylcysteine O-methyltransferase Ste14
LIDEVINLNDNEILIDRSFDRVLTVAFLGLIAASFYSALTKEHDLIRIEILSSIPINLLGAYSFWTRDEPRESTLLSETVIPALSFIFPSLILNNLIFFPATYSYNIGFIIAIPGIIISIISFLFLRKSFAIMPAVRGIVIAGPYRIVRHPLYLGELLYVFGMMLLAFNPFSILLMSISIILLVFRIEIEERKLLKYPDYYIYFQKVKYKMIPGLY